MDLTDIIAKADQSEFGRRFLERFLERGLGSLGKRDVDILVLHLLEVHAGLDLKSNHELSIALRLTEARIRALRYEARLKYPADEQRFVERQLLYVLAKAQFEVEAQRIVFVVEDSFLRNALQAHLKRRGAFADNSFNSELVKVSVDSLAPVLEDFYGQALAGEFLVEMKGAVNKAKFAAARRAFVLAAAKALGTGVVTAVKAVLGSP